MPLADPALTPIPHNTRVAVGKEWVIERFLREHGVRRYAHTYRNMLAFIKQGGHSKTEIVEYLLERWNAEPGGFISCYGVGDPFDHVELWGKNGVPRILVGHPYSLCEEGLQTLAGFGRLGLSVSISAQSWYGFGTLQIEVGNSTYHA